MDLTRGLRADVLGPPASRSCPLHRWNWLPLLTGVAVATALRQVATVDAVLKWPNDVLLDDAKLAGILVQRIDPDAAVVGIGLNVTARATELPPGATSLIEHDSATTDQDTVLHAILRELDATYQRWVDRNGDPDSSEVGIRYRDLCSSLGRNVRIELGGGAVQVGRVTAIDPHGRLVVAGRHFSAGDVVHVR